MIGAAFDMNKSLSKHVYSEKERMELIANLHPCVGMTAKDQKVRFNFGIYTQHDDLNQTNQQPKVESYILNHNNFCYDIIN